MRKEREVIINIIQNNKTSNYRLAEFFARKYSENFINKQNKQSEKS